MKEQINILIVDDFVVKLRLNENIQDYFNDYLEKGDYPFSIHILDEKIINQNRLWKYLEDETKTSPDFILLDWQFENEGDIVINKFYTGKVILKKLMEKKEQAYRGELTQQQTALYKNLEVIALSSFIQGVSFSNLEDLLLGGCIAAVAKDTFDESVESNIEKKSFLLNYIHKWIVLKGFKEEPDPAYDGDRFGELDANIKLQWKSKRERIKGERVDEIKIEEKNGVTDLEESVSFVVFQKVVEGQPIHIIEENHPTFNQNKSHITKRYLSRMVKGGHIETRDLHRWFHIAIEQEYPFVIEYLQQKGFYKKEE